MNRLFDIVIPHHNRFDLIGTCLEKIPMKYKVFIVRGFNFAEACNKGASLSKADRLLFLNDDVILTKQVLNELEQHDEDIVGIPLHIPSLGKTVYGMNMYWGKYGNQNNLKDSVKTQLAFESSSDCQIPATGAAFTIKREVFEKLGGLNEIYKNGGEDNELFLKAKEKGYSFGYVNSICDHLHSSSAGRYDYDDENHKILTERFPKKRLIDILGNDASTNVTISVIVPTRMVTGEPDCLDSLKKQTHKSIEIIVIRDKDLKGASWARNQGRKKATGEYLFFCDDDIDLKPMMLEILLTKLRYSNASIAYCNYDRFGLLRGKVSGVEWDVEKLKNENYISTMSLIKVKDYPAEGFDEKLDRFQDWDLWLRMAENGKYGIHINETLFNAYYKEGNISSNPDNLHSAINIIRLKHLKFITNNKKSMTIQSDKIIKRAVPDSRVSDNQESNSEDLGIKIELGGKNPIFLNGDYKHIDTQEFPHVEYLTKSFLAMPLENNSVKNIFAKRTIQKLSKKDVIVFLIECLRVLKPEGSIKLVVVDMKKAMGKFLQTYEGKYIDLLYGSQSDSTEFYLYGYTPESLKKLVLEAGFSNVRESSPTDSFFDPQIEFVMEANKPKQK